MTPLGPKHPEIQQLRRLLGRRAARRETGRFVVEGPKLVAEALGSTLTVHAVYAEPGIDVPGAGELVRLVAPRVLGRILDTVAPQPVAAVVAAPATSLAEVLAAPGVVLVLDQVRDPGNVGTLVRSVEAFGGAGLVLLAGSADPFQPKVVRSSAGSLLRTPIATDVAPGDLVDGCRAAGRPLLVTALAGGAAPEDAELHRTAVILGNEAHGVAPELTAAADGTVTIPMAGPTESLNVAMAGAVLAYAARRRR